MDKLLLNENEKKYMRMIINPFDEPAVKEPTFFPRSTKLLRSVIRNTVVLRSSSDRYLEICFNPGTLLKYNYALYPVIASTYKHGPIITNVTDVFYMKSSGTYSSSFFDGTNPRYVKPIASAIRSRLLYTSFATDHQARATGNMTPGYSESYGSTVTTVAGTNTVPYVLDQMYQNVEYSSGTTPIYLQGHTTGSNHPIYYMRHGEWITTFMRPQTIGTSGYQDNFEYNSLDTSVPYGTNKYIYQAWGFSATSTSPTIEIEAVTIWESVGLNIYGSLNYTNSPYGKCNVMQHLQGVPTYKGEMDNYKFSTLL